MSDITSNYLIKLTTFPLFHLAATTAVRAVETWLDGTDQILTNYFRQRRFYHLRLRLMNKNLEVRPCYSAQTLVFVNQIQFTFEQ